MSANNRIVASAALAALGLTLGAFALPAAAQESEAAKLQELQRAMTTPAAPAVKKPKTRAIVFDAEPEANKAQAPAQAAVAAVTGPMDCTALPPNVKTTAVDFTVQFKVNSAEVAASSELLLQQIGKVLALSPDRCVIVEGHTDVSGNPAHNVELSKARAQSVVGYIVDKVGLQRSRLVPVGKGSAQTIQNLDPRDPKNRRVVFKVVG